MSQAMRVAMFAVGAVRITRGASDSLSEDDVFKAFVRHINGDWGDVDEFDWELNNESLKFGFRLQSSYVAGNGTKFWIITDADRSATTILLPDEY